MNIKIVELKIKRADAAIFKAKTTLGRRLRRADSLRADLFCLQVDGKGKKVQYGSPRFEKFMSQLPKVTNFPPMPEVKPYNKFSNKKKFSS